MSHHRTDSETKDRREQQARRLSDEQRHRQEELHRARSEWWEQFVWVTAADLTGGFDTRIELLKVLSKQAGELTPDLVKVAQAFTRELYRDAN